MKTQLTLFAAIAAALTSLGSEIDLGSNRKLSFDPPNQWKIMTNVVRAPDGNRDYLIQMQAPTGSRGACLIRLFETTTEPARDLVRQKVADTGSGASAARAGSTAAPVQDFSLPEGYGAYVIVSSERPHARDHGFKSPAFGLLQLGHGVAATVTVSTDDPNDETFKAVIAAINSFKVNGP